MIAEFLQDASLEDGVRVLYFVVGGLQFKRGVQGKDPFGGVDIEELFAAMDMLAKRTEIDAAPFIGQWHPAIADLETYRPSHVDQYLLRQKLKPLLAQGRYTQSAYRASLGANSTDVERFVDELIDVLQKITTPEVGGYLAPLVRQGKTRLLTVATLNYEPATKGHAGSIAREFNCVIDGRPAALL